MDFFASQESARRRSGLLVVYYVAAVILIVLAVYAAITAIFFGASVKAGVTQESLPGWWDAQRLLAVAGVTLAIVLTGTLYKIARLSSGGAAVARLLGGVRVDPGTGDAAERRLLNVVEEMAIASGTPVPPVYILPEEEGINAFAAGFTPADAVIAVTRGCATGLSRDELQGVVAHEFSHILNGDMRLNLRLMGVLHGILVLALIGYGILRVMLRTSGRRSRGSSSSGRGGGGGQVAFALFGLALMVIGYVGVLFANLIKSAVSRQREFLADASAVQFTRNPGGIAGALKKILAAASGSRLASSHAAEASHLYFANGLRSSWVSLFATHPPLQERIRRLDPSFTGEAVTQAAGAPSRAAAVRPTPLSTSTLVGGSAFAVDARQVLAGIGAPEPAHLAYARVVLDELPPALREASRAPDGAEALIYAQLLSRDPAVRAEQVGIIERGAASPVVQGVRGHADAVAALPVRSRLPLAELAASTLRDAPAARLKRFGDILDALVRADRQIDWFEFALQRLVRSQLGSRSRRSVDLAVRFRQLEAVQEDARLVLSCLAAWGTRDTDAARAYGAGASSLGLAAEPLPADACTLGRFDAALERLRQGAPALRGRVLDACVRCVAADGQVNDMEAEGLRVIGGALDCPVPPLFPAAV